MTLAAAGQIGVDVERVSPRDYEVLSPEEPALCVVHHGSLAVGFTMMWTLKEAFLKALGIGLTISPRRVTLTSKVLGATLWSASARKRSMAPVR